jgi:hypothetical protein
MIKIKKKSLSIITASYYEEASMQYTLKNWLNYFKTKVIPTQVRNYHNS